MRKNRNPRRAEAGASGKSSHSGTPEFNSAAEINQAGKPNGVVLLLRNAELYGDFFVVAHLNGHGVQPLCRVASRESAAKVGEGFAALFDAKFVNVVGTLRFGTLAEGGTA